MTIFLYVLLSNLICLWGGGRFNPLHVSERRKR